VFPSRSGEEDEIGGLTEDDIDDVPLLIDRLPEEVELEEELANITLHVQQAKAQRELVNELLSLSKEQATTGVPHTAWTYTMCCDFAQNMDVPSYKGQQPGETYYYSPLNVYVFGCAEEFSDPGKSSLTAFAYPEYNGKKGGDNVASMVIRMLSLKGLLDVSKGTAKALNVVMDNCAGQNKNRMVLRLGALLVEMNYFATVQFVFLVVGHTKNICDRLFNLIKKNYRKKNIYTVDELVANCGELSMINAVEMQPEHFRKYDDLLNRHYKKFGTLGVLKWHIFTYNKEGNGDITLTVRTSNLDGTKTKSLKMNLPFRMPENVPLPTDEALRASFLCQRRAQVIREDWERMAVLEKPGLRPIKQVELYKKYRPFVPPEVADIICPKPSDEALRAYEKDKDAREAEKKRKRKNNF